MVPTRPNQNSTSISPQGASRSRHFVGADRTIVAVQSPCGRNRLREAAHRGSHPCVRARSITCRRRTAGRSPGHGAMRSAQRRRARGVRSRMRVERLHTVGWVPRAVRSRHGVGTSETRRFRGCPRIGACSAVARGVIAQVAVPLVREISAAARVVKPRRSTGSACRADPFDRGEGALRRPCARWQSRGSLCATESATGLLGMHWGGGTAAEREQSGAANGARWPRRRGSAFRREGGDEVSICDPWKPAAEGERLRLAPRRSPLVNHPDPVRDRGR